MSKGKGKLAAGMRCDGTKMAAFYFVIRNKGFLCYAPASFQGRSILIALIVP